MRWLLVILFCLPTALAQTWDDPGGDAEGPVSDGALDLRKLLIEEDQAGFQIELHVGDLQDTAGWRVDAGRWYVYLEHGVDRRVQIGRSYDGYWWALLEEANDAEPDGYAWVASLELEVDPAGILRTSVERQALADARGAPPTAGRLIQGVYAQSVPLTLDGGDRLPDEGELSFEVQIGPAQSGQIRLFSDDPWRATNGAAATYVYTIQVENSGSPADVELTAKDIPKGWSVLFPEPRIHVDGSGEAPVVLQTPFAHQHGARESFIVEARAEEGVGRVELGLEFLEVPQPSGHHDTMWFHTRNQANPFQEFNEIVAPGGWNSYIVMNAVEDEESDTLESKEARPTGGVARDRAYWFISMSPGLRMGLDFDLERTGRIEVPVSAPSPVEGAVLEGWLYHCVPVGETYECATLATMRQEGLDIQDRAVLSADVIPAEVADVVAYTPRSYLSLGLAVTSDRAQTTTGLDQLQLEPGGWIQLPLDEYEDPVDELFSSDVLRVQVRQTESAANAGLPIAVEAVVDNLVSEDMQVALAVSGTNAEWATLEGPADRRIDDLGREAVRIIVTPPADAQVGDRADLILHAKSDQGSSLVRFVVVVTDEPVEVAQVADAKDAPAPVVATLAALALLVRRR